MNDRWRALPDRHPHNARKDERERNHGADEPYGDRIPYAARERSASTHAWLFRPV